ncbi:MAG TPA: hypothetical protein VHE80_05360, partial [Acidimicrobiales bacterium]|nr:hypothetical protein [Acidimicrobiales bacterium]
EVSKARARAGVHAMDRAISAADVRSLALSFGGVRRAAVRRHPRRRDRLTVFALGEGGRSLTEDDRARLRSYLVSRMPPGTSVSVDDASRVPVSLRLVLRVDPGYDPLAVVAEARVRLGVDAAAATRPGLLLPGRPELGEEVHLSDVYAVLDGIPHLASAFVDLLHRAGEPPARRDRIDVGPFAVAVWGSSEPGAEPVTIAWEEARDR